MVYNNYSYYYTRLSTVSKGLLMTEDTYNRCLSAVSVFYNDMDDVVQPIKDLFTRACRSDDGQIFVKMNKSMINMFKLLRIRELADDLPDDKIIKYSANIK